jgi:YVTN family beta-propeller protein
MQSGRRALYGLILIVSFAVLVLPALAQRVIATVPVGYEPIAAVVNPVTNKVYVMNYGDSTVTVIDGVTYSTAYVSVDLSPGCRRQPSYQYNIHG